MKKYEVIAKKKNKASAWLSGVLAGLLLILSAALLIGTPSVSSGFAAENTLRLALEDGSADFTIDAIDPIELRRGEKVNSSHHNDDRDLVIVKADMSALADKIVVYTGRFYYMDSYVREGAAEYAISVLGDKHSVVKKYAPITDGATVGNEIPVPGYLLSIPASLCSQYDFEEGDVLLASNTSALPLVTETVDNLTERVRVEIHNLNAATNTYAGSVYYGNAYGKTTGQNQWNREVAFRMITKGDEAGTFVVSAYSQLQATTYQTEGENGGTADVPWNRDFPIPDPGFVLISSNVEDYNDPYVHAVFGMLNRGRAFSVGDKVRLSGKEFFDFEYSVTSSYDYVDPGDENEAGKGYPENRGAEQMMIYTKSVEDGSSELKTNEYGFEAAVNADGEIVKIGVNVIDIPQGGFVVSAQGLLRDFARTYFKRGASVSYNTANKTFTIVNTLSALRSETQNTINNARTDVDVYINGLYDLDTEALERYYGELRDTGERMIAQIDSMRQAQESGQSEEERIAQNLTLRTLRDTFETTKVNLTTAAIESNILEGRAVWHVPNVVGTETSLEGIRAVLDIFEKLHLNIIFLEEYYAGYSHAVNSYVPHNPYSKQYDYSGDEEGEDYGNDYFKAFYTEAKKRGFEIHISITAFYMSRTDRWQNEPDRLATVHPEWINKSSEGLTATVDGHQAIFADPANDEYRNMLSRYVREMFTNYPDLDGINLDFIRYPDKAAAGREFGYTMTSMRKFLQTYRYTFRGDDNTNETQLRKDFDKFIRSDKTIRAQWDAFRCDQVTLMVETLRTVMKGVKSQGLVSISTGPSAVSAKNELYQDWGSWVRRGLIDMCTPMAYYTASETVEKIAKEEIVLINNLAYAYVGIGPYQLLPPSEWVAQIAATNAAGAMGYSLFSSEQVLTDTAAVDLVASTVNKNKAIVPHADAQTVIAAVFADVLQKAQNVYLPAESMTAAQFDALKAETERIAAMSVQTARELFAVYKAVERIYRTPNTYVSFYAETRLRTAMSALMSNLNIKISRMLIESGEWDPSVHAARPVLSEPTANRVVLPPVTDTPEPKENKAPVVWIVIASIAGAAVVAVAVIVPVAIKMRRNKIKEGREEK
ncbi:MAG: family 10 glycosylhydrolase [Clostridia bacterium]|nr:family 10 glycosylhydrolase [Clostridia bacterium]